MPPPVIFVSRRGHFRHFAFGRIKGSRSSGGNLAFCPSRTRAAPLSSLSLQTLARPRPPPCPAAVVSSTRPAAAARARLLRPASARNLPPPVFRREGKEEKRESERVRRREGKRRGRASGSGDGHGHGARSLSFPIHPLDPLPSPPLSLLLTHPLSSSPLAGGEHCGGISWRWQWGRVRLQGDEPRRQRIRFVCCCCCRWTDEALPDHSPRASFVFQVPTMAGSNPSSVIVVLL